MLLLVEAEVARGLPEPALADVGSEEDLVAVLVVLLAPPILELDAEAAALRVPVGEPGARFLVGGEEVELLAELAVVALSASSSILRWASSSVLLDEGVGVDAGEHRLLLVAVPVGAGHRAELEGVGP